MPPRISRWEMTSLRMAGLPPRDGPSREGDDQDARRLALRKGLAAEPPAIELRFPEAAQLISRPAPKTIVELRRSRCSASRISQTRPSTKPSANTASIPPSPKMTVIVMSPHVAASPSLRRQGLLNGYCLWARLALVITGSLYPPNSPRKNADFTTLLRGKST